MRSSSSHQLVGSLLLLGGGVGMCFKPLHLFSTVGLYFCFLLPCQMLSNTFFAATETAGSLKEHKPNTTKHNGMLHHNTKKSNRLSLLVEW